MMSIMIALNANHNNPLKVRTSFTREDPSTPLRKDRGARAHLFRSHREYQKDEIDVDEISDVEAQPAATTELEAQHFPFSRRDEDEGSGTNEWGGARKRNFMDPQFLEAIEANKRVSMPEAPTSSMIGNQKANLFVERFLHLADIQLQRLLRHIGRKRSSLNISQWMQQQQQQGGGGDQAEHDEENREDTQQQQQQQQQLKRKWKGGGSKEGRKGSRRSGRREDDEGVLINNNSSSCFGEPKESSIAPASSSSSSMPSSSSSSAFLLGSSKNITECYRNHYLIQPADIFDEEVPQKTRRPSSRHSTILALLGDLNYCDRASAKVQGGSSDKKKKNNNNNNNNRASRYRLEALRGEEDAEAKAERIVDAFMCVLQDAGKASYPNVFLINTLDPIRDPLINGWAASLSSPIATNEEIKQRKHNRASDANDPKLRGIPSWFLKGDNQSKARPDEKSYLTSHLHHRINEVTSTAIQSILLQININSRKERRRNYLRDKCKGLDSNPQKSTPSTRSRAVKSTLSSPSSTAFLLPTMRQMQRLELRDLHIDLNEMRKAAAVERENEIMMAEAQERDHAKGGHHDDDYGGGNHRLKGPKRGAAFSPSSMATAVSSSQQQQQHQQQQKSPRKFRRSHRLLPKLYSCPMCPRKLTSQNKLTNHLAAHTGLDPYNCPICHSRFKYKKQLEWHLGQHQRNLSLICQLCGRVFKTIEQQHSHFLVHVAGYSSHFHLEEDYKSWKPCRLSSLSLPDKGTLRDIRLRADVDPLTDKRALGIMVSGDENEEYALEGSDFSGADVELYNDVANDNIADEVETGELKVMKSKEGFKTTGNR